MNSAESVGVHFTASLQLTIASLYRCKCSEVGVLVFRRQSKGYDTVGCVNRIVFTVQYVSLATLFAYYLQTQDDLLLRLPLSLSVLDLFLSFYKDSSFVFFRLITLEYGNNVWHACYSNDSRFVSLDSAEFAFSSMDC